MTEPQSRRRRLFSRGSCPETSPRSPTSCAPRPIGGAAAHRRRRGRAGLGELAVVGVVRRPARLRGRARAPLHLDLTLGTLGRRRAAGDLLLRRRAGAQARVRRRRPARPAPGRAAGRRRGRRDGRARRWSTSLWNLGAERRAARLGHPDRHRHRVRARGPRRDQHPPADGAAHVPADPGGGRRPAGHHDHRALLHRRPAPGATSLLALVPLAAFARAGPAPDPAAGGCCSRSRCVDLGAGARLGRARDRRRGAAGLHRAGASGAATAGRRARAWPSTSSTWSGRSRPASPCRSSPSSPPA